jgi:uncharacterized membrane protein YhaH (DUF805 family)
MDWMLMPLRRYADFSGRSRRMEYWMWVLFQVIIYVALVVLMMIFGGGMMMMAGDPSSMMAAGGIVMILGGLYFIWWLATLIPSIAVAVRRLHDTNRSGWWILAPVVPYVIAFVSMMGAATSGTQSGLAAGGVIGMLSVLAAMVLGLTVLVFMFLEGTKGPNKYGPDPKGADTGQVFA